MRAGVTAVMHFVERAVQAVVVPAIRAAHPRRTREQNEALMRERGEMPSTFTVRDVRDDEVNALARLHVVTWAATYPEVMRPPTFAIRSWQWREAFANRDGNWFCIVVENSKGDLVGFARGIRNKDKPTEGDLNKIYLLSEYQRLGLGKRMLAEVTDRFLAMRVTQMVVHAEANNPSCRFYEATGAVNTIDEKTGRPNGGSYIWNDLAALKVRLAK
jgi:ribosomal protein S18 acetylase RimI-like enzyme